ncbi:MAG: ABC transporter substrate-binding protein [Chloroflexota bacterium]
MEHRTATAGDWPERRIDRRAFLRRAGLMVGAAGLLAACGQPAAPAKPADSTAPKPAESKPAEAAKPAEATKPAAPAATTAPAAPAAAATAAPAAAAKPAEAAKPADAAKPSGASGGSFKIPVNANVTPWPPIGAVQNIMVNKAIFSQLIKYDKGNFAPSPDLAEKWEVSPDGLTWTFTLRKGVTWHDGKPFTSADAKFSFEVYQDEKINSILRSNLTPVVKIDTPNENTLVLVTKDKFSSLPEILCYLAFMLPKHLLEGKDMTKPPEEFINKPIGTGPFKFVEHARGDHLTVAAYEGFYLGKPKLDQVIYKIIPDVNTTVAQVRTGELDIAFIGTSHLDALKSASNVRIAEANQMDMRHIGFNHKNPRVAKWFTDKKVRQALAYAIDKQAIIDAVTDGKAYPLTNPIPPFLGNWQNKNLKLWPYDPDKAKALLKEAGFTPGAGGILQKDGEPFSFEMSSDKGQPDREQTGLMVQQNLKDVGVDVKLDLLDFNSYMGKWRQKREFEAVNWYYVVPSSPDLTAYWTTGSSLNEWGYSNPDVDKLFAEARTVFEPEKRKAIYDKVQEILADDQPVVFIYNPKELQAINAKVKNFPPMGYRDALQYLYEVSIE